MLLGRNLENVYRKGNLSMGMPWFPCTLGEFKTIRRMGKRTVIRKRFERPDSHWALSGAYNWRWYFMEPKNHVFKRKRKL